MMLRLLPTLLCLSFVFTARAELISNAQPSFKDPNSSLTDPDENYIQDSYQNPFSWQSAEQALQREIEKTLVLPPSLIRSFILVADKKLNPKPQLVQSVPELTEEAFSHLTTRQKVFAHASVAKALTRNLNGMDRFLAEMQLLGDMSEIRKFSESTKSRDNRIQFLVSDPGGTGVTDMIRTYAHFSDKELIFIHASGYDLDVDALAAKIQNEAQNNSILVFDHVERAPSQLLEVLELLVKYPALAGNMDVIVTFDSDSILTQAPRGQSPLTTYGLEAFAKIEPYIDSLHVVRRPMNPLYYEQIIRNNWMPAVKKLSQVLERKAQPAVLDQAFVQKFAKALYAQQEKEGISSVRKLFEIMYNPKIESCEVDLKRSKADRLSPALRRISNDYAAAMRKVLPQTP